MKSDLNTTSPWFTLMTLLRAMPLVLTLLNGVAPTRAANKNVWITWPDDTKESVKYMTVCVGENIEFHATTWWNEGSSWTWSPAGMTIMLSDHPDSYASKNFDSPGRTAVTATYNGETSYAMIVTAVNVEFSSLERIPIYGGPSPTPGNVQVTVSPSPLPAGVSVTLQLTTTIGSGAAQFSGGGTLEQSQAAPLSRYKEWPTAQ